MRSAVAIAILFVLMGLAALALFALPRDNDFDHSPLGSKGLEVWLQARGIPVVRSDPHIGRARSEISLRILFLPASQEETATSSADEDGETGGPKSWGGQSRLYGLPTLVIAPKWRPSLLRDGVLRQSDLLPLDPIEDVLHEIAPSGLRLERSDRGFAEALAGSQQRQRAGIALFRAQTFDRARLPRSCREITGVPAGALVVQCQDYPSLYLLSDPDLLNNHGLALGENAALAVSLMATLRGATETRPVYLDTAGLPLTQTKSRDEGRTYERSASDLTRFFAYPLSVIWGTLFAVVAICFWRGAWRFGPPSKDVSGQIELSKTAAIEAMARLLRLSGNDGRMVGQFVQNLLAEKAQLVFGPGSANQAGIERLFQRLARRDKAGAEALKNAAQALIHEGHSMRRPDLHRNLEIFRTLLGSIEFGIK